MNTDRTAAPWNCQMIGLTVVTSKTTYTDFARIVIK